MQRSFIACLRTAYALPYLPTEPPSGGIGIAEWDEALATIFVRLCAFPDDAKRLDELDRLIGVYDRHAVLSERNGLFDMRDDLLSCARVLRGWREELAADASMGRAA